MRTMITLVVAMAMLSAFCGASQAQRSLPRRECLAFNPDGTCVVLGVDPYGPNRYQAQQHNACLAECDNTLQFCLMSYVQSPSPAEWCGHVHAVCLRGCP